MFYCVYFFSPFDLKPVLARLLSQGLVAPWEISVFLEGRGCSVHFPPPCSLLRLECSLSLAQILFLSKIKIPTWFSEPNSNVTSSEASPISFSLFLAGLVTSPVYLHLHPWLLLWRIVGCYVYDNRVPLGAFGVGGPCHFHLWSLVLCWILNYSLLLSHEVSHAEDSVFEVGSLFIIFLFLY